MKGTADPRIAVNTKELLTANVGGEPPKRLTLSVSPRRVRLPDTVTVTPDWDSMKTISMSAKQFAAAAGSIA